MSELLRRDQEKLQQAADSEPNSGLEQSNQLEVSVDPLLTLEINESGSDRLSLPPGALTLAQAQQILHSVVENRRIAARRYADSQNTTSTDEKTVRARINRAEKKLAEKKEVVAATVAKYTPSARFPTDTELAKEVKGIQAKGTPLELLKEQVFRAHAEHHLPQLTAIVVDFVQGAAQNEERDAFEVALNTGEISTINLERDELWAAIDEARRERKPMTAASSSEPEEPVTPEYAVTDFVTLGVVMGRLLREYTTDPARAEDFPTDGEVAAAYEEEGLPPLRPSVLTTVVRQAHEEITEERARLARTAEREAALLAQKAAEAAPEPAAIEQARVTVLPELIAVEHPVSRPFFRMALNRAGITLPFDEQDTLYAELRAARGEEPEEEISDIPLRQLGVTERNTAFEETTHAEPEPEPTEDDLIADVMSEYLVADSIPTIDELRARFAERGVPQPDADLEQLHGAIADLVTEERDRVAAAAEALRQQEEAEASERAERAMEQAVTAIIAARDWLHPTTTAGDRGTTVQDIVAYQRITEDGEDGIDTVLGGRNVFNDVLQDEQFLDLTIEQRRQVLREVGHRLQHDFRTAQQDAEEAYDNLNLAQERAQNAQQQLDASRIAPVNPLIESNDSTLYQPDTSAEDLDRKAALLRENIKQKSQLAAEKTKAGLQKAKTKVQEASQTVKSELSSDKSSSESGFVGRFLDKIFRINPDKREKYDL